MGLLQIKCNPKSLPLNVSCFIHLFQQHLEGWWNLTCLESVVLFSQTHCFYGIPTGLQGGLKPYHTISQICCVLDPKQREMKHNHFVGCEEGEEQTCASGMAGRQWPELGSDFIPRCCALTSELQNCISLHFPPAETRMISPERPLRWKSP